MSEEQTTETFKELKKNATPIMEGGKAFMTDDSILITENTVMTHEDIRHILSCIDCPLCDCREYIKSALIDFGNAWNILSCAEEKNPEIVERIEDEFPGIPDKLQELAEQGLIG